MSDAEQAIRILLVEDNLVVQQYMTAALATHARNQIVAVLDDGLRAAEQACQLRPDIILLDLFLPGIDGIDVIRRVMNQCPCPIVVISAELDCEDRDLAFEAQRAGAVSVLSKPQGMEEHDFASFSNRLCRTVEMMAKVKVVRRWFDQQPAPGSAPKTMINPAMLRLDCDVLLIGSSTGGPAALYKILESLGPDFPFSVLIAQHIAAGFIDTLCSWLGKTGCSIKPGAEGEELLPGHVYIAPDEKHLVIGADGLLHIVECRQARFTPSVDMLFSSVAEYYCGRVCAMILTGMGDDGTQGMTRLFDNGAFTIAQAESSCVIFGMPKMAINAGVVKAILTLEEICHLLAKR